MKNECQDYRPLIPQSMVEDLADDIRRSLEAHLAECAPCAREQELYRNTFQTLGAERDVDAPRHFFVHPPESRPVFWERFRLGIPLWASLAAGFLLAVGVLAGASLARLEVAGHPDGWTIQFGGSLPAPPPAIVPVVDTQAMKAEILLDLQESVRERQERSIRALRQELARSDRELSARQKAQLDAVLSQLEARLHGHVLASTASLQQSTELSLARVYETVQAQRARDLSMLQDRLDRIAVNGEIKSNQTDAILETLLMVAELKLQ